MRRFVLPPAFDMVGAGISYNGLRHARRNRLSNVNSIMSSGCFVLPLLFAVPGHSAMSCAPLLAQDGRSSLRNSLIFMVIKISTLFIKKLLTFLFKWCIL
jgi:hypothetical protein